MGINCNTVWMNNSSFQLQDLYIQDYYKILRAVLQRKQSCLWAGIQLLGITLAAAPFVSNHLGYLFVLFEVLFEVLFLILEPNDWTTIFGENVTTNSQ